MPHELLLRHLNIVDPANGREERDGDLAICDGILVEPSALSPQAEVQDCRGLTATPGFIDLHVHLREPGQTYKDDLLTTTAAAAHGGFTTVLAMPNTVPAIDSLEHFAPLRERLPLAPVKVFQACALTKGRQGLELAEISALAASGVFPAFSDDGSTPQDPMLMRRAMEMLAAAKLPVIDHCELLALSKPGVMHRGTVSAELGLPGQPREAEENIVRRDIGFCAETGCRLHLQHLSSAGSVALLREARRRGLPVTGEATPHHLQFTDEAVRQFGSNAKMAPPLREESDRQALLEGIADGTITVIATDHAPHTAEEKAAGMLKAPFGIIGLEAAFPVCLTQLWDSGLVSLSRLISLFTSGPASVLGLAAGTLSLGAPADVTLLDLAVRRPLEVSRFHSRSRNCPYDGLVCRGRVVQVFVDGIARL